ncbi:hypothetical protein ACL6C3_27245 [Capilliphycus salinus ALCB114379]|uniref:hypothetical protein n=1 Tax=Capilliphycus salinus TaxID=2768948 RepID=UPI0039A6FC09
MSGADFPPNINPSDPTPPTDSHPLELNQTSQHLTNSENEEWETVNLPNAIGIDQLPIVDETSPEESRREAVEQNYTSPELEVRQVEIRQTESQNPSQLIQALHQCNRDLVNRVTDLEAELDECRQALQDKESLVDRRTQELAFATEQVSRLFGKLELSNQVIRRQQVLVETLTEQWETSQTRMAQMERECALAQQRYNEQFHELVQTQNVCRELRSRLHRQQRHTLQFKAALERCLEMQSRQSNLDAVEPNRVSLNLPKIENVTSTDSSAESSVLEQFPYQMSGSRSQPVQPWSADFTDDNNSVERLDEIVRQEQQQYDDFDEEMVDEWLELDEPISDHLYEDLEDLSQLHHLQNHQPSLPASELSPLPNLEELENYWFQDNPSDSSLTSNPFQETEVQDSQAEQPPQIHPSPRFVEDELDRIRIEYASSTLPSFELDTGKSGFIPAPDQPLDQLHRGSQPPKQPVSSPSKTGNWPAPLIQPTRPKKLRSLASIQLPKFPQSLPVEPVMASRNEPEPF